MGSAATAYPIGLIGNAAVNDMVGGERVVVLSGGLTGGVFSADVDGMGLTFRYDGSSYTDEETGSAWSPGGEAVAGPLEGRGSSRLPSRRGFWFSIAGAVPGIELHLP